MTEHETFPGKPYVVTSKAGCTITDASGELEETCEPGKQKVVHAPSEKLFTSAPAIVRETFNRAALALRLLGGGVKTPAWVKALEAALAPQMTSAYIVEYKSGTLFVHSDYEQQAGLADVVSAVAAEYAPEGTELVQKWMPPSNITSAKYKSVWRNRSVKLSEYAPPPTDASVNGLFMNARIDIIPPWVFAGVTYAEQTFISCQAGALPVKFMFPDLITSAQGSTRGLLSGFAKLQEIPAAWTFDCLLYGENFAAGCSSLQRAHGLQLKSLKNAAGFMDGTKIDKRSSLSILDSIPAWTDGESHPLTLGIHIDHQTDEDVVNAIAEAEAKGWTLTVQWNGTATAAAASTWGRRKPVFARLDEPLEDGTRVLDWGHYVTDPSGYTEFASLEEAKEHFNITD